MSASPKEKADTRFRFSFAAPASSGEQSFNGANPRETLNRAHRYSAFVRQMKRILPLGALGLALAVLAYALQPRDGEQIAMTFERMGTIENDLAMINPRLTGVDDHGMPFVVTASSAVQLGPATERIRLENVHAELTMDNGMRVDVAAAHGIVDNQEQKLELFDGIRLTSAEGYSAETSSAQADLRLGIVYGTSPVTAEGSLGTLSANGFTFERNAGILRFSGDVRMQVYGEME